MYIFPPSAQSLVLWKRWSAWLCDTCRRKPNEPSSASTINNTLIPITSTGIRVLRKKTSLTCKRLPEETTSLCRRVVCRISTAPWMAIVAFSTHIRSDTATIWPFVYATSETTIAPPLELTLQASLGVAGVTALRCSPDVRNKSWKYSRVNSVVRAQPTSQSTNILIRLRLPLLLTPASFRACQNKRCRGGGKIIGYAICFGAGTLCVVPTVANIVTVLATHTQPLNSFLVTVKKRVVNYVTFHKRHSSVEKYIQNGETDFSISSILARKSFYSALLQKVSWGNVEYATPYESQYPLTRNRVKNIFAETSKASATLDFLASLHKVTIKHFWDVTKIIVTEVEILADFVFENRAFETRWGGGWTKVKLTVRSWFKAPLA